VTRACSAKLKICIISAALPPRLDGIGDYTAHLAQELARSAEVHILTAEGKRHAAIAGVNIVPAFAPTEPPTVWRILQHVESIRPDWVILQYQPFCYGRWGLNLHLPLMVRKLKDRCPGTRFALMAHEDFVPVINWKFAVMTTWQRWQLWSLGRSADLVLFSIQPWVDKYRGWFPGKPVLHLPVGSNIPLVGLSAVEARERLGIPMGHIVLGLFGTAHACRLLHLVRGAASAARQGGRDVTLLYMGPDAESIRGQLGDLPIRAEGPLPAEEVSRRFAAVDVALAPFVDGVSTRRTSLMTGLQHGVATVGTRGPLTDRALVEQHERALLLADVAKTDEFCVQVQRAVDDGNLRHRLGRAAEILYTQEFAWDRIASKLQAVLGAPHCSV
jgi:glycosyltransferase involved in cell wall biosynthesis